MPRTYAAILPLLMDQPIWRQIREIRPDYAERFARDKPRLPEQSRPLRSGQFAGRSRGRNLRAPKNFVCHPVSDSNEAALQQQNSFDRRARVAIEERVQKRAIELIGRNIRSTGAPPGRLGLAMMKSHPAKEPRIRENQRPPPLLQNEVIVFLRLESDRLRPQFAAHPEMKPNPIPGGEFEEHLFPSGRGPQKTAAGQLLHDPSRIGPAEDSFSRVELHRNDLLAKTGVPLLSEEFYFGQFRHPAK